MFENFNFIDWLIGNLLWSVLLVPVVIFLWRLHLVSAIFLAIYLLKNNRLGLGTGAKFYLADRFIEIWYRRNWNICYEKNKIYSPQKGALYAYFETSGIDDILIKKKLAETRRDPKSEKDLIVPIESLFFL